MIRILAFLIFSTLLLSHTAQSQKLFSTYVGLGPGRHFEEPFPYIEQVNNGRIAILLNQYVRVSSQFSVGLSAMASGRWSAILGGASAPGNYYDPKTNTEFINYNNLNASTYLLKNKYNWIMKKNFTIYCDLGFGISRYQYVHTARSAFSLAPEIGLSKDSFQLAATFIWGGKTPAFIGYSNFPNYFLLNSIRSNRLYLTFSYKIF